MKKLFLNTGWQVAGKAVGVISALVTTTLLVRLLPTKTYGNYIFLTTAVLLFLNLSDLGVGFFSVRQAARSAKPSRVYSQAFLLKFILTSLAWIAFCILVALLPQFQEIRFVAVLASLGLFFFNLKTSAEIVFRTRLEFNKKVVLEALGSLFFVAAVIWAYQQRQTNLAWIIVFWLTAAAFSGLMSFWLVLKQADWRTFPSFRALKKLFFQSLPLGARQTIFAVYDQGVDNFFLKTFSGSLQVGWYGLAYKIYASLTILAAFFMNSLFPALSRQNRKQTRKSFQTAFGFLFLSGLILSVVLYFSAAFVVNLIAGPRFFLSTVILKILSAALFFSYLNHATGYTIIALGGQKRLLYLSLAALAVNLIGNFIFIPRWGGVGAAWVTLATEVVMFVLSGGEVAKQFAKR